MAMQVGDRELNIRNLDRVLFPRAGTTKAQLLDYYVRVADAMLPHLRERQLHMHRFPAGADGPHFWQKQWPEPRPPWLSSVQVWNRSKGAMADAVERVEHLGDPFAEVLTLRQTLGFTAQA